MALYEKIQQDLYAALKSGDRSAATALRGLMADLKNRKIEKNAPLTEEDEVRALNAAAKKRKESIEMYRKGSRDDLVAEESRELAIIESLLPAALSTGEIEAIITRVISETGAASLQDIGKVMPVVMKAVAGRGDGRTIQQMVRTRLGG